MLNDLLQVVSENISINSKAWVMRNDLGDLISARLKGQQCLIEYSKILSVGSHLIHLTAQERKNIDCKRAYANQTWKKQKQKILSMTTVF